GGPTSASSAVTSSRSMSDFSQTRSCDRLPPRIAARIDRSCRIWDTRASSAVANAAALSSRAGTFMRLKDEFGPAGLSSCTLSSLGTNRRNQSEDPLAPRPPRGQGLSGNDLQQRRALPQARGAGLHPEARRDARDVDERRRAVPVRGGAKRLARDQELLRHRLPLFEALDCAHRVPGADRLVGL